MLKFSLSSIQKSQEAIGIADTAWVNAITYSHSPEFENPLLGRAVIESNLQTIRKEIRLQKELFLRLALTGANKEALSQAAIHLYHSNVGASPFASIANDTGVLSFGLVNLLTDEERCQILMHEISHITIRHVNKQKIKSDTQIPDKYLFYPFLDEQGKIEIERKKQFQEAIHEHKQRIEQLHKVLSKAQHERTKEENAEINLFRGYIPRFRRDTMPKALFLLGLAKGMFSMVSGDSLYISDVDDRGVGAYGKIIDDYEGEITIRFSYNKNNSPEELAKAYVKDCEEIYEGLKKTYPKVRKNYDENDYLMECGAFIEELLAAPALRQAFAPSYYEYINHYSEKKMVHPVVELNRLAT